MTGRLASPLSLIIAAILGGLVSQGISRWMPEARAQDGTKVQDEIRARKIVVIDKAGNERIILESKIEELKIEGIPESKLDKAEITLKGIGKDRHRLDLSASDGFSSINLHRGIDLMYSAVANNHGAFVRMGGYGIIKPAPILLDVKNNGAASVTISDDVRTRAVLGVTDLETIKTGETTKTAPSALTLFDKEGKVIWKAP